MAVHSYRCREGIDIDFFLRNSQRTRFSSVSVSRSVSTVPELKDASDTSTDYDDLDSAIPLRIFSEAGTCQQRRFLLHGSSHHHYCFHVGRTLQWRIQEMKKLLISQDMNLLLLLFTGAGFYHSLPFGKSGQKLLSCPNGNVLTSGRQAAIPSSATVSAMITESSLG